MLVGGQQDRQRRIRFAAALRQRFGRRAFQARAQAARGSPFRV
jgi:hypothetical protein